MITQLSYSMFHGVLFPPVDESKVDGDTDVLRLRRVKRFTPALTAPIQSAPLVVFDLETTGLDNKADRIIEIGAIKLVGGKPVAEYSSLVHTTVELTDDIIRLTGITREMLVGQPEIGDVLPQFLDFIDGCILVAHNADFDLGMLHAACARAGIDLEWPCFCTLKMARELLPQLENKKLDTLATHYGQTFEARHRSIGDVKVTVGVLHGMFAKEGRSLQQWSHMHNYAVTPS